MSKVKSMCIKTAEKIGNKKLAVKLALLGNVASNSVVRTDDAYDDIKHFVTPKEFSGYLSALTAEGFYEPETDPFYKGKLGYVTKVTVE